VTPGRTHGTRPGVDPVHTIDVAHPARPPESVEQEVEAAWHHVRRSKTLRLLKVIHGYGSSGKGGSTRTVVRNWAFAHRRHLRAVIEGERYSLFDSETQVVRRACGDYPDADLGTDNPGFLILWIH
jgi:hypothetical protein